MTALRARRATCSALPPRARAALSGLFGAVSLLSTTALAQPAPGSTAPGRAPATEARRKDEAREHFQHGLVLFDEGAWDPALAEFERARALYPSRAATKNAAACLRLLKRYDEALDAFEELLAFPGLPRDEQELAEREVASLRPLVGAVMIADAEPGATIVIDGRGRGKTPAPQQRLSVGTHAVRVYKEGFEPFETRIQVSGSESVLVSAHLVRIGAVASAAPPAPPRDPPPRDPLTPAGAVTLGLGGIGLGVGAVLGALTLRDASAIRAHCMGDVCPTDQLPAADSARTTATGSTVALVVGGALAVTGLTLLVVRSRSRASSTAVVIGPGSVIAAGVF